MQMHAKLRSYICTSGKLGDLMFLLYDDAPWVVFVSVHDILKPALQLERV